MTTLLPIHRVEKVWGRDELPAPFTNVTDARVGEIWFDPPAAMPDLLVKYLFTSEKLSVQVHPDDAQAPDGMSGKEECWFILDAQPGARLAIGLKESLSKEELRAAALDGSIEELLIWHEVAAGDFFYLPAGTIHAIGPGISLIEVQQNADITYRLYDYGRPRELHLDDALRVAKRQSYARRKRDMIPAAGEFTLHEGPHFRLDRIDGVPSPSAAKRYAGRLLLIPVEGDYVVNGQKVTAGSCSLVDDISAITCNSGKALIAQPS
ncbi:class I mannose-6-phosphate isomerase [Parerythrobacter jejuensis]|uniref:Mannose-6-phosphate isomerase n=1 Tax=Parerythrobacter jejuensis TaxID=795812 RepID=A0A845AQT3_9SPHN|nr:class I mannose-6-phosphate isomerase [Parerythrobacter jejuensis]MXP30866.1 mannose-6-phosphate isomerase [Parerythrobacter jejuensis]MXP33626.1 mannose-6-phosphate isomerase [Parerythrobacter jejuensis]